MTMGVTAMQAAPPAGKVRIAFLGGSHSHAYEKAKVALANPMFDVAGIAETDTALLAKYQALGLKALTRESILGDATIRAVAVESAVADHAADAALALEAGKHVHVEKPPAHTRAGFEKLYRLASSKKLLLQSGYMWRYNPGLVKAFEAVRQGWLGEIYFVRGVMNNLLAPARRPDWGQFAGGQMFEQGAHLVDIVVRLLGKPEGVTPYLQKHAKLDDSLQDNTLAVLRYPRALAVIQAAAFQPNAAAYRTVEIQGTNGTAVVKPLDNPRLEIDLLKAAGPYTAGMNAVALPAYARYRDDFVEFAAAINGTGPLAVSLETERDVQETLLLASRMS
jgi:predicted dehydrogenase